jgi:hypothetical protein
MSWVEITQPVGICTTTDGKDVVPISGMKAQFRNEIAGNAAGRETQ